MIEVKLTYFKDSGKYYTNTIIVYPPDIGYWDIITDIKMLARLGVLPGLVEGCKEFHILVTIAEFPHLILTKEFN